MTDIPTHQPLLHPASVLDPASVESRHGSAESKTARIAMIAEKLARDATTNQLLRDRRNQPAETANL